MNQSLSERRADAVKGYLVGQGVGSARLTSSGRGENSPVADNESAAGRQQNRRVEVVISPVELTNALTEARVMTSPDWAAMTAAHSGLFLTGRDGAAPKLDACGHSDRNCGERRAIQRAYWLLRNGIGDAGAALDRIHRLRHRHHRRGHHRGAGRRRADRHGQAHRGARFARCRAGQHRGFHGAVAIRNRHASRRPRARCWARSAAMRAYLACAESFTLLEQRFPELLPPAGLRAAPQPVSRFRRASGRRRCAPSWRRAAASASRASG